MKVSESKEIVGPITESQIVFLYFPQQPNALLIYLNEALRKDLNQEYLLFVDNNDHSVSSVFYKVRACIRKGLKLHVCIDPEASAMYRLHARQAP